MATRRTWLWILVTIVGLGLVGLVAMAVGGMYFMSHHIDARRSTRADAVQAFDAARAPFQHAQAVFALDEHDRPQQVRQLGDLPTAARQAEVVWILAWEPDRDRLVKVSLPFWMLKFGRQKINISAGGVDFDHLQLDVVELARVGPVLLLDFRGPGGRRVLVWTE